MLSLRYKAQLQHLAQHPVAALLCALGRYVRRVSRGRLYYGRHKRTLGYVQIGCALAEVGARRRFYAVCAVPKVHRVHVHAQYLVLGMAHLQQKRQHCFVGLARQRLFGRKVCQLYQLLGYGARALRIAAAAQVVYYSAAYAPYVYAVMREEARPPPPRTPCAHARAAHPYPRVCDPRPCSARRPPRRRCHT